MTNSEAIKMLKSKMDGSVDTSYEWTECVRLAIKALEQEPRKDEVILTKEEYGELVSSEFDNGYTKGYTEALEQNDVLDEIRAEIEKLRFGQPLRKYVVDECLEIIDKYRESEE